MFNIATPISHLFNNYDIAVMLSNYSDCLEYRDHSPKFGIEKQKLFHCELQPIHNLVDDDFLYLEKIKKEINSLELVSFHMATCFDGPLIEENIFVSGKRKYSELQMLENAANNFKEIKKIFGSKISIAVENNNFYNTEAYNHVCDPSFINRVVRENDLYFLFDIAHAQVSSYNMNIPYESYCADLPMDRIIQLHICKSGINQKMAFDAHLMPEILEFSEVEKLINSCSNLKYFTIEYYKDPLYLKDTLIKLKDLLIRYE